MMMPYLEVLESVSKMDWRFTVIVPQEIPGNRQCREKKLNKFLLEVFQNDISVVVCFDEPIGLVSVVLPYVNKCLE